MEGIVNRVAQSGIITLELENFFPQEPPLTIDLKDILFHGMVLREKDLRDYLDQIDLSHFEGRNLNVHCSADVVLPQYAYLLISARFSGVVKNLFWGDTVSFENQLAVEAINNLDTDEFEDKRVVVKGCADKVILPQLYFALGNKLKPVVKSLMYGEACSTVPLYKKPKA